MEIIKIVIGIMVIIILMFGFALVIGRLTSNHQRLYATPARGKATVVVPAYSGIEQIAIASTNPTVSLFPQGPSTLALTSFDTCQCNQRCDHEPYKCINDRPKIMAVVAGNNVDSGRLKPICNRCSDYRPSVYATWWESPRPAA